MFDFVAVEEEEDAGAVVVFGDIVELLDLKKLIFIERHENRLHRFGYSRIYNAE